MSTFRSGKLSEVGKSRPTINAPYIVNGSAWYTADLKFSGMLYGKILRSPYPHAKIKRIDTTEAERLPGVVSVVTHKDAPKFRYNSSHSLEAIPKDEYVLADKARFVGDKVAAVAAREKDIAEEALELIEVEYEELPAIYDPEEAMKPDAPKIHEYMGNNITTHLTNEWGDVKRGFEGADYIFEDEYSTQAAHPCPIEPHACISVYKSGKIEIWSGTQAPHRFLPKLSDIFGIPRNKVRIHQPFIGGGFGNKIDIYLEPVTTLLSMKSGAPVFMEFTHEEMLSTTFPRHPSVTKLKIGVKKDGAITSIQARTVIDTGAYATQGPGVLGAMVFSSKNLVSLYRKPNFKYDAYCVYTNKTPSGAFRGYGNPQTAFALESILDTIAEELGIDPIKLRIKNAISKGDTDPTTKLKIKSCGVIECAERAARVIGWKKRHRGWDKGKKRSGLGMAWMINISGVGRTMDETSSAEVKIRSDGKINLVISAVDIGQGIMTTTAQIAAEELGIQSKDVDVTRADTIQPVDRGTYASGGLYVTGEAVRRAAADAKRQLLKKAAWTLAEKVENLLIDGGKIRVRKKPKRGMSIGEAMKGVEGGEITGKSTFTPKSSAPSFGVAGAEVEVDVETGEVTPKVLVYAHDIGRAINPAIAEGQMEGGMVQGLGYALTEELIWDKKTGKMLNPRFVDYKILTARNLPKIVPVIVETGEPTGPYAAKGLGEPPLIPIAPAIANAIYDAVGVRVKQLPITPEKLLEGIKEKNSRR